MANKIKLQEVGAYACRQQIEMLKDQDNLLLMQNNPDDFMINLSVNIIRMAYEEKKIMNKF